MISRIIDSFLCYFDIHPSHPTVAKKIIQVIAEMTALGMIGRFDQPLALLIAPTTSLVALVAKQTDAALRIRHSCNSNRVFVVHGAADHAFCPNQERWEHTGASLHNLVDNHVFMRHSSQRQLINIAGNILRLTDKQGF